MESSISWREGKLEFNDETFEHIALKLERRYGVEIKLEGKEIKEVKYSGVLKNISVEQALKAIQMTTEFTYVIDDNLVIIKSRKEKKNNESQLTINLNHRCLWYKNPDKKKPENADTFPGNRIS